eukprot:1137115-Karenia_brevis.AAC.1
MSFTKAGDKASRLILVPKSSISTVWVRIGHCSLANVRMNTPMGPLTAAHGDLALASLNDCVAK